MDLVIPAVDFLNLVLSGLESFQHEFVNIVVGKWVDTGVKESNVAAVKGQKVLSSPLGIVILERVPGIMTLERVPANCSISGLGLVGLQKSANT